MPTEKTTTEEAQISSQGLKILADQFADAWIDYHNIKNEKGEKIEWSEHTFQIDIYNDQSDNLVVMKPAQVGLSTLEVIKNFRDAERQKMDIIYTLPTDSDVSIFVGGKVNRIIQNNPHLQKLTADKDSIEQKRVGMSMVYFRGTWTKKAAIMVTADRLVHDEKDSSKQDVIADYQARLQHSKFKQTHVFSHPSSPNAGVDIEWQLSDQKEWFIKCPHCGKEQYLSWDTENPKKMSIDLDIEEFVCKKCHGVLSRVDRCVGRWIARYPRDKYPERKWSGYHISLLMAPWIDAKYIVKKYRDVQEGKQTMDFFYNKILGLPYAGSGNSVTEDMVKGIWSDEKISTNERLIIGIDSGVVLHYVVGTKRGLLGYGKLKDWMEYKNEGQGDSKKDVPLNETAEYFLKKFPRSIAIVDQGGDIIGPRKLREKYPGRVFLCYYQRDKKAMQLIEWGKGDENGRVMADRNRMIQLVIDEMKDKLFHLYNGENREAWHDYWLHWSHIYRIVEEDALGKPQYVWKRSDRDDWVHTTVYWRIGVSRFSEDGAILGVEKEKGPNSYLLNPDLTVSYNPDEMFGGQKGEEPWWANDNDGDWRNV